ncbi:uncharacterized protein [Ambystoma mexicanum]|uniref:uncharacterized protein n=1 Tax=Ambystoma mexicanum TaxID=8296 RepID=UPI0037E9C1A0
MQATYGLPSRNAHFLIPGSIRKSSEALEAGSAMWDETKANTRGPWKWGYSDQEMAKLQSILRPFGGPANLVVGAESSRQLGPLCQGLPSANLLSTSSSMCCIQKENASYPLVPSGQRPTPLHLALGHQCMQEAAKGDFQGVEQSSQMEVVIPVTHSVPEFCLHFCATDLLVEASHRKRPRLLPPHRKMHLEVQRGMVELTPAVQEQQQNLRPHRLVPPEYRQLVDSINLGEVGGLHQAEMLYRQFTVWPARTVVQPEQSTLTPYSKGKGGRQQLHISWGSNRSHIKTRKCTQASPQGHLPPKKRFSPKYQRPLPLL